MDVAELRQLCVGKPRLEQATIVARAIAGLSPIAGSDESEIDGTGELHLEGYVNNSTHRSASELIDPSNFPCVYFLHAVGTDLVKVGWTRDLLERIKKLKTGCPHPLSLLAIHPGDRSLELAYHQNFEPYRQRGEWFLFTSGIRKWCLLTLRNNHVEFFRPMARHLHTEEGLLEWN